MTASPDRSRPASRAPASHPIREAYARLSEHVAAALPSGPQRIGPPVRIEVEASAVDPLSWLAAQAGLPRLYWSDRDRTRLVGGVGVADRLSLDHSLNPADLMNRAAGRLEGAAAGIRYYGGFRFDTRAPVSHRWQAFGRGWLVLPRFEWVQEGGRLTFACNVLPGHDSAQGIMAEMGRLGDEAVWPAAPGRPRWREDLPRREEWLALVDRICAEADGHPDGPTKVVLARRTSFTFDAELEPLSLLQASYRSPEPCFHFFFDPGGGTTFVGSSPERLFHRLGRRISSEALAGTRARGTTAHDDARLRQELLHCGKEGREHASVVRHIEDGLGRLTDVLDRDREISVVELNHVQHLSVRMAGRLKPWVTDAALLDALHPTPAVAGEPAQAALTRIGELEPFDRGWYAGPVGYVGDDETQFAVAIRSGLVRGHRVDLFAGAGILTGSRPEDEWGELESKIGGMQAVWAHE